MIILDTDYISILQWGGDKGDAILRRVYAEGLTDAPATIVTYEEQIRGWMGKLTKARSLVEEVGLYMKLCMATRILSPCIDI